MDKTSFEPHTAYTVSLRDEHGTARPAKLYVCGSHDTFLIARMGGDGTLRRIEYDRIERIVSQSAVAPEKRFLVPAALLDAETWRDRTQMNVYASAPHVGH